jgi:predicted outer membrane repeat protein
VAFVTNNASITFAPSLSGQTILLTNGQITLSTNVTIDGSTLPNGVMVSGNNASRLFSVAAAATAAFNSLTLKNGYDVSGVGGGAIYVSGKLTLTNCVVANNTTTYGGGGVCNRGTLTVNNSTVAGNNAPSAFGGGIYNSSGANLAVNNSTLAKNTAANSFGGGIFTQGSASVNSSTLANNSASSALGGGIYFLAGTLNLTNCIIASNAGGDVAGAGTISSFVNSLTNRPDINLASLGNYGGPTPTMPPLPGSPAIDAGNDAAAGSLTTDQRGYPRVSGAHMDIGAVEAQYASAGNSPLLQNTAWSAANGGTLQFTFTNTANTDFTALTATNVALPLINWTVLGKVSQISAGQYQFAATNTAAVPQQFYRVVSP